VFGMRAAVPAPAMVLRWRARAGVLHLNTIFEAVATTGRVKTSSRASSGHPVATSGKHRTTARMTPTDRGEPVPNGSSLSCDS
jgi:hypothetical protein